MSLTADERIVPHDSWGTFDLINDDRSIALALTDTWYTTRRGFHKVTSSDRTTWHVQRDLQRMPWPPTSTPPAHPEFDDAATRSRAQDSAHVPLEVTYCLLTSLPPNMNLKPEAASSDCALHSMALGDSGANGEASCSRVSAVDEFWRARSWSERR